MKKILLLAAALMPTILFAQEQMETVDLLEENYKNQLQVLEIQDNLLKALLQVPFVKRVYIYPALFESHNISKKIVTHPQIAIWKGKKPTKIAPQMQKFANEYLDDMPAKFYPLLDPDIWPKQPKENDWHRVGAMLQDTIVTPGTISEETLIQQTK